MTERGCYKRYDAEFIKETVELIKSSGKSVAAIGKDLGVSSSTLYGWLDREKEGGLKKNESILGQGGSIEVGRLQRELAEVKQERDILKKVVAIFSKQPKGGSYL